MKNGYGNYAEVLAMSKKKTLKVSPPKLISTKILSSTPGRLRLRVSHSHRQPEQMQKFATALNANPNIHQVRTSVQNGTITIQHDTNADSIQDVFVTFKDLGIIFTDVTDGNTEVAAGLSSAVVDLNKRVQQATSGLVDLRILFPLGLATLSLRQLVARGLQMEIIPWYVLAWYAFDSFIKLNHSLGSQSAKD